MSRSSVNAQPHQTEHIRWTYHVAQNPRPAWLGISTFFLLLALLGIANAIRNPFPESLVNVLGAVGMAGLALISLPVSGYTNLRREPPECDEGQRIRTNGWPIHLPMSAMLLGLGTAGILDAYDLESNTFSRFPPEVVLALGVGAVAVFVWSLVLAGWHRRLVFTPEALHYERGRFFQATLPWDAMSELTPVCDANIGHGGQGDLDKPSRWNLRAGVRVVPGESARIHGKTMLKEFRGKQVVGIDCSSYRTDPNTLINAIFLLAERPELRPLLSTPEGAVLFEGPSWRTRARMRVGDRWDRTTDRIIGMGTTFPENR